jgi:hypothetical protein
MFRADIGAGLGQLATCPRTVIKEVTRRSASGHIDYNI